ncbi:MAG: tetraacyldisaccharide 4'-kinase [Desulfurivibrio sp.]|nr:tetraacyldisaccharide 4'-kinase [Desulfurivibrio sp.]
MKARGLRWFYRLGLLFSPFYSLLMRCRARLYRRGWGLRSWRPPVPVLSVGNLTMGGTGKTPLVIYLARLLQQNGYRPAVLSRGYGRQKREAGGAAPLGADGQTLVLAAEPGRDHHFDPAMVGDEPLLLACSLPGVPVLVNSRRQQSARLAVDELACDSLLLDDGFQHLAVARDLDLVLFSAAALPVGARVFPGGPLREPWSALRRAAAVVITGTAAYNQGEVERFRHGLRRDFPELPVFLGEYLPVGLVDKPGGKAMPLDKARRRPLFGVAGLARPESLRESLGRENFLLTGFQAFADHHSYTLADYDALVAAARQRHAAGLITTEKDLVKLAPLAAARSPAGVAPDFPLLALRVALFMEEAFDEFVAQRLRKTG